MTEAFIVAGVLAALGSFVAVGALAPEGVLVLGAVLVAVGLLVGVPASALYHRALRIALLARGPLPRRWWLDPVPLHRALPASDRRPVARWFLVGVVSAGVSLLGCGLTLVSVLRAR